MASSKKPRIEAVADESAQPAKVFELHHAVPGQHLLQARVGELECLGKGRHARRAGSRHVQLGDAKGDSVLQACCIQSCEIDSRHALFASPLDEWFPPELDGVLRELAGHVAGVRHSSDSIFWDLPKLKDQRVSRFPVTRRGPRACEEA